MMFVAAVDMFMFVEDVVDVLYAPMFVVERRSPIPPPPETLTIRDARLVTS